MGCHCCDFYNRLCLANKFVLFSVSVFAEASCHVVRRPMERATWQEAEGDL